METIEFATNYKAVLEKINAIDPIAYSRSRNYLNGAVTQLSPYISRGVISTRQIYQSVLDRGYKLPEIEHFVKELAWRDYFQRTLQAKPELVNSAIQAPQQKVLHERLPVAITQATTGIEAIDKGVQNLYDTGYMHNHMRMYVASIVCNVAQSHWRLPSQWLYYHLLDGDVASNVCSWQWVCAANSQKKYFANQENINKYCNTQQRGTFLDVAYEDFDHMEIPEILREIHTPILKTELPAMGNIEINPSKPTLLYNLYNLDPMWHLELDCNRILLLEPSHFTQFPVGQKTIDFVLDLSKNISGMQVFVGEYADLAKLYGIEKFIFKEHPLFRHYKGKMNERDWIFPLVTSYYPSFFGYWKKCMKSIGA